MRISDWSSDVCSSDLFRASVNLLLLPIIIKDISAAGRTPMVVCVCNAIREKELREIAREGFQDPCSAYARVGRRPKCGQCLPFAKSIIAAEHAIDCRSEEHTSELQSLMRISYAVFCLKKK